MGEQVVFTNCVFEKLCFPENTIFIVLSANTAVAVKEMYVKNRKFYEKWWVALEHGKRCLCLFRF